MGEEIPLEPRNSCLTYVSENGGRALLLRKKTFDSLCKQKRFSDGPYSESFGDGQEPYNPWRQAFGTLDKGVVVYCEVHKDMQRRVEEEMKAEKELTERKAKLLVGTCLDKLIEEDILTPCTIRVQRDGKTFIERGYKFSNDYVEEQILRLAHGGERLGKD